ncbi:MAG: AI-2E family transporter [Sphaerobacteraceae bacterium]|nr:MAG: AI-2E family transporter [Sphaerobacteraceae bacterium]
MIDLSSPHRKRLILILIALAAIGWVLWEGRQSLVPFALGAILAYLMTPLVSLFQMVFPKRGILAGFGSVFAILLTYALFLTAFITAGYYVFPPLIQETVEFIEAIPRYWDISQREFSLLMDWYEDEVPDQWKAQIEENLASLGSQVLSTTQSALMATLGAVSSIIGFGAGLALLPLWIFYVLKDREKGAERFYTMWPRHWQTDVRNLVTIVDRVLSAYIRGQIFVSATVGLATGLAMWAIGIEPVLVLAVLAGLTNLIPILGPVIAFFIIALVTLATEPDRIWLVAIAFIGIQQLESTFLVPRIHGHAVRVNPAIVMILVVVGGAIWGLLGMIVILPIAAAIRDVFVYAYNRIEVPEDEDELEAEPPPGQLPLEPPENNSS